MNHALFIIGTRGSELALWQANHVAGILKKHGQASRIKIIKTKGDVIDDIPLDKIEGKGFFTKELELALLNKDIDLAVHSYKDLPTTDTPGLTVAMLTERADPSEVLIINREAVDGDEIFSIRKNARVGTSSARRYSQLHAWRPDVIITDLRGNVPTRLRKLKEKQYDAILIARAGIDRLGLKTSGLHCETLPPALFIPAPAQGVIAVQARGGDENILSCLQKISNEHVSETSAVEREVMNSFQGGCNLPLGAYCEKSEDNDGTTIYRLWVAIAKDKNDFPACFYFESKNMAGLASKATGRIKAIKPGSIFITRDIQRSGFFHRCLNANGFQVSGKSLVRFEKIPFKEIPLTDWIFFPSKNAVKYFFDQNPQLGDEVKFAAIGTGTSAMLRKYGKRAVFIGHSTDTALSGKQFLSRAANCRVLFPQAEGSLRTVQRQFKRPADAIDLKVYRTVAARAPDIDADNFDILIFTSPSNVNAFFASMKINARHKIIAMGDATENELKKRGIRVHKKPRTFDDLGLVQAVFGVAAPLIPPKGGR